MRISDWSSDVCSSDLRSPNFGGSASPLKMTLPLLCGRRPVMTRASVDLPEPDSPTTATVWPRGTCKLTSCRTLKWFERSEEHTSELQSLMRISYAVFCLKKKHTTT